MRKTLSILLGFCLLFLVVISCKHEEDDRVILNAVTDYDGNSYDAIRIGKQVWMKSNLRTTHFSDGKPISTPESEVTWSNTKAYVYDPSASEIPGYDPKVYGLYYNWPAVYNAHKICPEGWHVPSDAEWKEMSDYVSSVAKYTYFGVRENIAKALASTAGWAESNEGGTPGFHPEANNATGFSAFPAGTYNGPVELNNGATHGDWNTGANFWSSTEYEGNESYAWFFSLGYSGAGVDNWYCPKNYGYSVRCVRD